MSICGHASGNDVRLHQALDIRAGYRGQDLVSVQHTSNVGEMDKPVRGKIYRARRRPVIGVAVIDILFRAEAETSSDGEQPFAPQRFEKSVVQPGEVADK